MGLKFHWSIYFFFPALFLGKALGWPVIPLAMVVAGIWLWLGWRWFDVVLLALAASAAVGVTWWVARESAGRMGLESAGELAVFGSAHFIWFATVLLPVRWLARRFLGA